MDMDILNYVFELLPCLSCNKQMLELNETRRNGLAFDMILQGQGCDWSHAFLNTKKAGHSYQVNRRAYYAMRCVGGGHQNLKGFITL